MLRELKLYQSVFPKSWAMKYHGFEENGRRPVGPYAELELDLAEVYILSPSVIWHWKTPKCT